MKMTNAVLVFPCYSDIAFHRLRRYIIHEVCNMKQEDVPMSEKEVGFVSHYFGKISVAGIEITCSPLTVGDKVHIDGHTTDFVMDIKSMQVEHETVSEANKGDSIGLKVPQKVRPHDKVYLVVPD